MSIRYSRVLIHGVDVSDRVNSICESSYGYRVCFTDGASTFNKVDVNIFIDNELSLADYDFSDSDISVGYPNKEKGLLAIETERHTPIILNRQDVVTLAKSLKVTAEDLK